MSKSSEQYELNTDKIKNFNSSLGGIDDDRNELIKELKKLSNQKN